MVNYPSSYDTFTNPGSGSLVTDPSHAQQHADANDAIEAVQAVVGTTSGTAILKDFQAGDFAEKKSQLTFGAAGYDLGTAALVEGESLTYNGSEIVGSTISGSGGTSPLTTKGDLYAYGTANTRLAVGTTNGQMLLADSSQATGLSWANYGQGAQAPTTSDPNTSSASYVDIPNAVGTSSLETTFTTKTGRVLVLLRARLFNNNASSTTCIAIQRDAESEVGEMCVSYNGATTNMGFPAATFHIFTGLTPGSSYTFTGRWKVSSGTATAQSTNHYIAALDI